MKEGKKKKQQNISENDIQLHDEEETPYNPVLHNENKSNSQEKKSSKRMSKSKGKKNFEFLNEGY